ncbi:hypothetical protein DC3_57470 [Deinococcus cellulosilyticus NBRC 106333 = KACC 11606]|uniref:Transposase n=1 Tax=Deinococcus cellulosilyticus (strain DSM 18568 / NBRC 106333 / KACC 11606 / 5516J-15) TaxID=1223518 RepID=A0A511NBD0_DEIC1|nr:hypothetical protein DC3_57470 [Deinococcus cellulosilyticus NBRC 106333 = KACC 11606]
MFLHKQWITMLCMSILPDWRIRELAQQGMIEPVNKHLVGRIQKGGDVGCDQKPSDTDLTEAGRVRRLNASRRLEHSSSARPSAFLF